MLFFLKINIFFFDGNNIIFDKEKSTTLEFKIINENIYIKSFNDNLYFSININNVYVSKVPISKFIIEIIKSSPDETIITVGYNHKGVIFYMSSSEIDSSINFLNEKHNIVLLRKTIPVPVSVSVPIPVPVSVPIPVPISESTPKIIDNLNFDILLESPGSNLLIYEERLTYVNEFYQKNKQIFDLILDGLLSNSIPISFDTKINNSYYGCNFKIFIKALRTSLLYVESKIITKKYDKLSSEKLIDYLSNDFIVKSNMFKENTYIKNKDAILASLFYIFNNLKYNFNNVTDKILKNNENYTIYELDIKENKMKEKDFLYDNIISDENLTFHGTNSNAAFSILFIGMLGITDYLNSRNDFGFGTYLCESLSFVKTYGNYRFIFKCKNRNRSLGHYENFYNIQSDEEIKLVGIVFSNKSNESFDSKIEKYFVKYVKKYENCLDFSTLDKDNRDKFLNLDDKDLFQTIESINLNSIKIIDKELLSKLLNFPNLKFLSMKNCFNFNGNIENDLSIIPDSVEYFFINNNHDHEISLKGFIFNPKLKNLFVTGEYIKYFQYLIEFHNMNPSLFYFKKSEIISKYTNEFLKDSSIGENTKIHMY